MIHIPNIIFKFLRPADGVASVHLGPPGDTGPHFMTAVLFRAVKGQVPGQERARTDEAHLAPQYIEQLGQFIHGSGSYEPAYRREAYMIGQQLSGCIAPVIHGFEFEHPEYPAVQSRSFLGKQDTAFIGYVQEYADHQQQRRQQDQRQQAAGEVHYPFNLYIFHPVKLLIVTRYAGSKLASS